MAQNTMAAPPINQSISTWIVVNKKVINDTANLLGVPAAAIAAAAAEEASHIISDVSIPYVGTMSRENFIDAMQDTLAGNIYSNDYLAKDFADRERDIRLGLKRESLFPERLPGGMGMTQAYHPTMADIGWYNLNLGNSILVLNRYLAQTGPGDQYEGDPLKLAKYANNLRQFAADLAYMREGTGWKITGMVVKQLDDTFANAYGNQYLRLTDDLQTALLVTGYKQGLNKIIGNIEDFPHDWQNGGLPRLSDPGAGDGAPFVLRNFNTIQDLLNRNSISDPPTKTFGLGPSGPDEAASAPLWLPQASVVRTDPSAGTQPLQQNQFSLPAFADPSTRTPFAQPAVTSAPQGAPIHLHSVDVDGVPAPFYSPDPAYLGQGPVGSPLPTSASPNGSLGDEMIGQRLGNFRFPEVPFSFGDLRPLPLTRPSVPEASDSSLFPPGGPIMHERPFSPKFPEVPISFKDLRPLPLTDPSVREVPMAPWFPSHDPTYGQAADPMFARPPATVEDAQTLPWMRPPTQMVATDDWLRPRDLTSWVNEIQQLPWMQPVAPGGPARPLFPLPDPMTDEWPATWTFPGSRTLT